jgi:hypothetical protein
MNKMNNKKILELSEAALKSADSIHHSKKFGAKNMF